MAWMKGTILWSFQMMVILGFVAFFLMTVGLGGVNEGVRTNSRLEAEKIAGIVNSMMTAPPGTQDSYLLTGQDCRVTITESGIFFHREKSSGYAGFIKSSVKVVPPTGNGNIDCSTQPVTITFKREGTQLRIN